MRLWNVPTNYLCDKHLLKEHSDLHKLINAIANNVSIKNHIKKGFVEVHNIPSRHIALVRELLTRGFGHTSLIEDVDVKLLKNCRRGKIDKSLSIKELCYWCKHCNQRIVESMREPVRSANGSI